MCRTSLIKTENTAMTSMISRLPATCASHDDDDLTRPKIIIHKIHRPKFALATKCNTKLYKAKYLVSV